MKNTNKKNITLFMMSYLFIFFAQGSSYCYFVEFLTRRYYTPIQRSLIMTLGSIISIFVQILFGYICDKTKKMKKYVNVMCLVFALITAIFYYFEYKTYLPYLIFGSIFIALFRATISAYDNWVMESNEVVANNFGPIRAFGSIGWAIGSYVTDWVIMKFGYQYISYEVIAAVAVTFVINLLISDAQKTSSDKIDFKDTKTLFANKNYLIIVMTLFMVFVAQASLDITIVDKFAHINDQVNGISYYWTLTALLELPLFFLGARIEEKFSSISLLMFGTFIYALRFVLYSMATTNSQMLWISSLQICSFPLIQTSSKKLVLDETPDNLKSSGTQIGMAIYSTASSLLSPLVAAFFEERFGINYALSIIALFAFASLLLAFVYRKTKRQTN